MKIKSLFLIIFIIVLIFLLSVCEKNEIIKIGYVGTLTGINSELGVYGRNGAQIAVDEINLSGGLNGKPLELVVRDDENNVETALKADKEFYKEGVVAIIGHMTSGMAELSVPYINEKKILMISPTISVDYLGRKDDYFFRMIPSNKDQAYEISKVMYIEKSHKVAVLYDNTNRAFTETLKTEFVEKYEAGTGEIVLVEEFNGLNTDYLKLAEDVNKSGADSVFIIGGSENAAMISQHLYIKNITLKIYLTSWAMTKELINHGGKAVEGACLVNFYNNDIYGEKYEKFSAEYKMKYKDNPGFVAQFAYEAVMVLFDAMKNSQDLSTDSLKTYINQTLEFEGLREPLAFDKYGDMNRSHYIYKIENGEFKLTSMGGNI